MSKVACYPIGRDAAAPIVVPHKTVSRVHAEAIPLPDGRLYVTDCASTNGTFINEDGQWRRISQDFASPGARLRFGDVEVSVPDLLTQISRLQGSSTIGQTGTSSAELAMHRKELSGELSAQRKYFAERFTALEQHFAELRERMAHLEGLLDGLREAIAIQRGAA